MALSLQEHKWPLLFRCVYDRLCGTMYTINNITIQMVIKGAILNYTFIVYIYLSNRWRDQLDKETCPMVFIWLQCLYHYLVYWHTRNSLLTLGAQWLLACWLPKKHGEVMLLVCAEKLRVCPCCHHHGYLQITSYAAHLQEFRQQPSSNILDGGTIPYRSVNVRYTTTVNVTMPHNYYGNDSGDYDQ